MTVPELLQAPFVLVHLHVLALAPVALHELLLAGDGPGRRVGQASRPRVGGLALQEVRGVAAAERREPVVPQLPDSLHDVVEEGAVVRGHEERTAAPDEHRLEPLEGRDVEVVRGLVEQEQVRVRGQLPGQRHAGLLPAGELRGPAAPAGARDAQAVQGLVDALIEAVAIEGLEAVAQGGIRLRLDGHGTRRLELLELLLHAHDIGGPLAHESPDR